MKSKLALIILACLLVLPVSHAVAQSNQNLSIFVEGNKITPSIAPFMEKGRTIVEARSLFKALGIQLAWDQRTKTVTGTKSGLKLQMTINQKIATVNGKKVEIDASPRVVRGKTLIPLRFVSTAFGAEVLWNKAKQRIDVNGLQFKDSTLENMVRARSASLARSCPFFKAMLRSSPIWKVRSWILTRRVFCIRQAILAVSSS